MKKYLALLSGVIMVAFTFNNIKTSHADSEPFGDTASIAFAEQLWQALAGRNLVGHSAIQHKPYKGTHPHGAVLETLSDKLALNGHEGMVFVKRNYGGAGVSIGAVRNNRAKFIKDVTVMYQREEAYDEENQNWFWAKYSSDGRLESNPRGKKLAGRVAKGKPKGCIACHMSAPGGDYLFVQ